MIRQGGMVTSPWDGMPDEIKDEKSFRHMLDSYDASIATSDQAVGEIINTLKELDIYDDCIIIISGDHRETIGQMGMYFEHGVAAESVARVPFGIRWPGKTKGTKNSELIYQYDLLPTMMQELGLDVPTAWDGEGFSSALHGQSFKGRDYLVYGCGIFSLQRSVLTKGWSLVKTFNSGCLNLEERYLFDMNKDFDQTNNIAESHSDVVSDLERKYTDWWNQWCLGPDAVTDPFHTQTSRFEYYPESEMVKRLEHGERSEQLKDFRQRRQRQRLRDEALPGGYL